MIRISLATMLSVLFLVQLSDCQGQEIKADVVIYGGTASGAIAAVAAAREGKSVVLIEASNHLGGMVSGGLGATDTGNRRCIGGYSRKFFLRVREFYEKKYGKNSQQVKDCSDGYRFEPSVALKVFEDMLGEVKVTPHFGESLKSVTMKSQRIIAIETSKGKKYIGKVFIDASYEGDLLAKAGVSYTFGRESQAKYGESLAGVQKYSSAHQWPVKVSGVDANGQPLPFVQAEAPGKPGQGDKKLQAYNYRLCLTQDPKLRLPFPKPANYDPLQFELLARYLKERPTVTVRQLMNPVKVPNGKTDTNNNGPFSTDYIGKNWDYPEADHATRQRIAQEHIDYTKGFLYFLANDPRVPKKLQAEMRSWGLSKGEFENNDHWPPQLYVREARRMLGEFIMTEKDIMKEHEKADSVGLGSYNTDSHHCQRFLREDGSVLNEGDFQVRVQPYAIPYRSLIPNKQECENLLVTVCLSASHVAYGTIRMEPVYMILGHASGVAAAMASDGKGSVHDITVAELQEKLVSQKAVLSPKGLGGPVASALRIPLEKLAGIVVDDTAAKKVGTWLPSTSIGPFVGDEYLHDNNIEQGKSSVRFIPKLKMAGQYDVRLFYPATSNRATNVEVIVHTGRKDHKKIVNQKKSAGTTGMSLGIFELPAGETAWVEIRNTGANGHVIADAVQFLKK